MSPTLRDADDSGTHVLKDYTDALKTTTESKRDYDGGGSEIVPCHALYLSLVTPYMNVAPRTQKMSLGFSKRLHSVVL